MEDTHRLELHNVAAMAHQEVFQQQVNIHGFIRGRNEGHEHVASG